MASGGELEILASYVFCIRVYFFFCREAKYVKESYEKVKAVVFIVELIFVDSKDIKIFDIFFYNCSFFCV